MTTNDIHDLCERLVIVQSWLNITHERQTIAEAKDTIERQSAENKRLRGLLGELIDYAEECRARLDCHDAGIMGDEPVKAAQAALTGEDTAGSPTSQNTEPGLPFSDAGEP